MTGLVPEWTYRDDDTIHEDCDRAPCDDCLILAELHPDEGA